MIKIKDSIYRTEDYEGASMGEAFHFVKRLLRGENSENFEEREYQPIVDPKDRRGIPEDIFIGLEQFFCAEIHSKGQDGITYALIPKEKENLIQIYHALSEKVRAAYGEKTTIFRELAACNGFIYIIHHEIQDIMIQAMQRRMREMGEKIPDAEIPSFDEIRADNIKRLADYVFLQAESGRNQFEVALYSRASSGKIEIAGRGPDGEMLMICYQAFRLIKEDLVEVNSKYLIPRNIRIARMCQAEILPHGQGVSYILTVEKSCGRK